MQLTLHVPHRARTRHTRTSLWIVVLLLASTLSPLTTAQTEREVKRSSRRTSAADAASPNRPRAPTPDAKQRRTSRQSTRERAAAHQMRRLAALAAVREIVEAASQINDRFQQAQTLASAAELLWKNDEAYVRLLFARAWTVAAVADREADEETDSSTASLSITSPVIETTEARDAVLLIAARCDAQLAEELMREREAGIEARESGEATMQPASAIAALRRSVWGELSLESQRRLNLARTLLEQGVVQNASRIAVPAAGEGITAETIEFLITLRRANAQLADDLYRLMLAAQRRRAVETTANHVSLAASYVVSPSMFAVVDADGGLRLRHIRVATPSDVTPVATFTPDLRRAFGDFAIDVLLRPQIVSDPTDVAALTEATQHYFAIERLLPFFARENAAASIALRARRDALAAQLEATRREQLGRAASDSFTDKRRADDALRPARENMRALPEGAARDQARLRLVGAAVRHRRWADARIAAAGISDSTLKKDADVLIRAGQIAHLESSYAAETIDDYARAARFVEESDVPPAWKSWGYAQAARLAFARRHLQRANEFLDQARTYAARAAAGSEEQIAAFILAARATHDIAPRRLHETLAELVRAVNAHTDFDGEAALRVPGQHATPDDAEERETKAEEAENDEAPLMTVTLEELFMLAAYMDFAGALRDAQSVEKVLPRARAVFGVAKATLLANARTEPARRPFR